MFDRVRLGERERTGRTSGRRRQQCAELRDVRGRLALLLPTPGRDHDRGLGGAHARCLRKRASRIRGGLVRVEAGDDVEGPISEGQSLHLAHDESAAGVRSRAISINGAAASMPLTVAPRCSASFRNNPAPHPTSSKRVARPISSSSRTASYSAMKFGSWVAKSRARSPQS